MQPEVIRLGASPTSNCAVQPGDLLRLTFGYGTTANNGNVLTQTIARPSFTASQSYTYDAVNRLQSMTEAPLSQTYVYDAFGKLAAEYGGSSGTQAACGTPTCYVSVDQLGSTRLVTDANGNTVRRYDYTPFGEELWAGTGGRTTAMGYQSGPDGFNPKFTGQHRDTENFLDYFHARYYSPQQGRFVSVDPENAGAALANPQTWNGYAYVGNNPINITDPNGESWATVMFGAMGFIAGALSGGALAPAWWYSAIMTGATTAGAQYTFEKAVNSGNIWAIAGVFVGGPPTFPDYSGLGGGINGGVYGSGSMGPFIFSFEEWKNGRVVLPNGDARIYGWLGRGAPILKAAGERASHDIGCVIPGFGWGATGMALGDSGGGLFVPSQQTPLAFRSPVTGNIVGFSPAKPFSQTGTLSSSNMAEFARDLFPQKITRTSSLVGFGKVSGVNKLGAWLGRAAPVAGVVSFGIGAAVVYNCLSK